MMHLILVDFGEWRKKLYPLALTRPVSELRIGILTITEKWALRLNAPYSYLTEDYLSEKYSLISEEEMNREPNEFLLIRGNCCPDEYLIDTAYQLQLGQALSDTHGLVMARTNREGVKHFQQGDLAYFDLIRCQHDITCIIYPEDIFLQNGKQIDVDFQFLTAGRESAPISSTNQILGDRIFAEAGVVVECSTLNSLNGPIYLGKNSEIWENCAVRGPFALCEGSQLKMGSRVYSQVTVGPYSRVGGEMNTCVIQGYSSKGHDGYLGSAVMGEWCNWGADTNNSNLKNNYKSVRVYDYSTEDYRDSGQQFYGLIMGDHAKCAINTAFNTGTVVGVGASIYGAGFPPTFVPDFSWGGAEGFEEHELDRMLETAHLVYARRNRTFDQVEINLLKHVFNLTKKYRHP